MHRYTSDSHMDAYMPCPDRTQRAVFRLQLGHSACPNGVRSTLVVMLPSWDFIDLQLLRGPAQLMSDCFFFLFFFPFFCPLSYLFPLSESGSAIRLTVRPAAEENIKKKKKKMN